jgi:hypothetical protein
MMNKVRRYVPFVLGAIGLSATAGAIAIGCDNSGTVPLPDAGGQDGTVSDAIVQGDVAKEAAPPVDASGETGPLKDGGGPDGDAHANADAEAGPADAARRFDGAPGTFPAAMAAGVCELIANCCGTSADAATFNFPLCYQGQLPTATTGGIGGSTAGANLLDAGNIVFDPVSAQACLDILGQVDCSTNQLSSLVEAQLYKDCFGAFTGSVPAGSPCNGTIECAAGNYCLPVDGGAGDAGAIGLCKALEANGQSCGVFSTGSAAQSVCSYRGSGNTGLFCEHFDPNMPTQNLADAAAWTCAPQEALDAGCQQNQDCLSFACHSNRCATSIFVAGPSTCTVFALEAGSPADASGE